MFILQLGENDMKVGDKVIITHSPYDRVKNGTIATIIKIEDYWYLSHRRTYVLDTKPNSLFYEHEIKKVEDG